MNKQFLAIIVIVVGGLFGVLALTNNSKKSTDKDVSGGSSSSAQASEHVVGAGKKNVTLVEYGDFECPACKSYFPLIEEIRKDYGDNLKFQFRNFPLNQIHPNAFLGSRAAEAAGKQNKFFEMYSLLYENQTAWVKASNPTTILESYAKQLGLNEALFKTDMMSAATSATINADIKAGQALGATSTPTFVINGKRIEENPRSIEDFKKLIDEASKN